MGQLWRSIERPTDDRITATQVRDSRAELCTGAELFAFGLDSDLQINPVGCGHRVVFSVAGPRNDRT